MSNQQQKDYLAYIELLRNKEFRRKWIRLDKFQNVVKMKLNPTILKNSHYFLFDQLKNSVKAKYPYESICNMQTLIDYFDYNRCGVRANLEFLLAYDQINEDLQTLEKKMWISSFWEQDEYKNLQKIYLTNYVNFKKDQSIDLQKEVPYQFQYQINPSFFAKRIDQSEVTLIEQDPKKNKFGQKAKQNVQIKNEHVQQKDDQVYSLFIKALKDFKL